MSSQQVQYPNLFPTGETNMTVKYSNEKHEWKNLILWFIIIFIIVYILFLLFKPSSILSKEGDVQVVNQGKALLYTFIITIVIIAILYIFQSK